MEVLACTLDAKGSNSRLARVILKDLGLTSHLLRLGNSAAYNHSGRSISSVAHAITLLGWERVRELVGALKYVEHFGKRSPGLRELMVSALLSAYHGREVALALRYPWPEEAYMAGLFRGLGEVLVARHYPEEYAQILLIVDQEKVPAPAACVRVMGCPWDEVGLRVARQWGLPDKVQMCLAGQLRSGSAALDRCLMSIAEFSRKLTETLYREGAGLDAVALSPVEDVNGQSSLVTVRDLRRAVDTALQETMGTLALLQIPCDALKLEHQAEAARQTLGLDRVFGPASAQALESAMQEARRQLPAGDFELSAFISSLTGPVHAAGCDRVVFGLVNEERTRLRGRLGAGEEIDAVLDAFDVPFDNREPLMQALHRQRDLLVDCEQDAQYAGAPIVRRLTPQAFLLLPVALDGETVGFLYADCRRPVTGLEAGLVYCGRIRDLITQALRRKARGKAG